MVAARRASLSSDNSYSKEIWVKLNIYVRTHNTETTKFQIKEQLLIPVN